MANFSYKALDTNKTIIESTISAKSRDEVAQMLAKRGLSPLVIKSVGENFQIRGTVPLVDKITFCRYLSIMISSGLSIAEGVEILRSETKHPLMRRILGDIVYGLEQGQQLSSIFERYPEVFESYFLTLTRAGEISGNLGDVFKYLEVELRAEYSLNSKVKGALLYPAIVFTAMIGMGIMMFFFVLPQIGKVFLNLQLPLPELTKKMFTISMALSKQFPAIMIGSAVCIVVGIWALRKRYVRDMLFVFVRPVPLIRNLIIKIDLARFNRIFSTLIRSAVPITDALEISLKLLSWHEYRKLATILPEEVRKGKSLAETIKAQHSFPSLMIQMIAAGEKTATLDSTLADLASFYEGEVEEEVKSLTQIIEPVLMLCVGIAVGGMILSIIGPIYSVVGSFQQASGGPR